MVLLNGIPVTVAADLVHIPLTWMCRSNMQDDEPRPEPKPQANGSTERLEGWKDISSYLNRGVRTAQRWKEKGLPVHKHEATGTIYALSSELDAWLAHQTPENEESTGILEGKQLGGIKVAAWKTRVVLALGVVIILLATGVAYYVGLRRCSASDRLDSAAGVSRTH
jgi:hypothetical protein